MCGIIGYVGSRSATPILLEGLAALEYRGYDSAGIAVLDPSGDIHIRKESGKLTALVESLNGNSPIGTSGVGHTRWATHGSPTQPNAHPHTDCSGDLVIVHNGIVENFLVLRERLQNEGHIFASQTDSEVIAHLLEQLLAEGLSLEDASRRTTASLTGANAVVVLHRLHPSSLLAFRLGNAGGLSIGYGEGETLLASDLPALLPHTRRIAFLGAGEMVVVTPSGAIYSDISGQPIEKEPTLLPYDPISVTKQGYPHFMLKEIAEQPEAVMNTIRGRAPFDTSEVLLEDFPFSQQQVRSWRRVVVVGMGTSFHAALLGRLMLESLAGIPADADNSAEFRYRNPIVDSSTLVISVAQSGETADTLAAMEEAQRNRCPQITICNNEGSQATRLADYTLLLRAGPEVGVASSKTFTCSMVALYLLSIYLGTLRGYLAVDRREALVSELARLPKLIGSLLTDDRPYKALAELYYQKEHFLYLGRGAGYPLILEGALKLKELAYIHAEGTTAAEMKHGPIALIDERIPVVALAPRDRLYDKTLGNIAELKARNATVIALITQGDVTLPGRVDHVLAIPPASELLTPILAAVPLQLLAYHLAVRRGCDVDQPRNLAKTVTVE